MSTNTQGDKAPLPGSINGVDHDKYIGEIIPPKSHGHRKRKCISMAYTYSKLHTPTSIRLLKPAMQGQKSKSSYGYSTDPLLYSMITADLDSSPCYTALSYTWGDPKVFYRNRSEIRPPSDWECKCFGIQIDGQAVTIPANLFSALLSIQHLSTGSTYDKDKVLPKDLEYLWVDALCINQSDLAEKSAQVLLMRRIYSESKSVLVWLGGLDFEAQEAFQTLELLSNQIKEARDKNGDIQGLELLPELQLDDPRFYEALGFENHISIRRWSSIYSLLNRSWFQRAWIVQEFVLPKTVNGLCGLTFFNGAAISGWIAALQYFDGLSKLQQLGPLLTDGYHLTKLQVLRRSGWSEPSERYILFSNQELDEWNSDALICLINVRERIQQGRKNFESNPFPVKQDLLCLSTSTFYFRSTRASDPRDKLYAFLSISNDEFLSSKGEGLPDYTMTPQTIYQDLTERMICEGKYLGPLYMVEDPSQRKMKDLPSWVPDYSTTCRPTAFHLPETSVLYAARGLGGLQASYPKPGSLQVFGYCLSVVTHLARVSDLDEGGLSATAEFLSHLPRIMGIKKPSACEQPDQNDLKIEEPSIDPWNTYNKQSRLEQYCRTLIIDSLKGEYPAPEACVMRTKIEFRRRLSSLAHKVITDAANNKNRDEYEKDFQSVVQENAAFESILLPGEMKPLHEQISELKTNGPGLIMLTGGDFGDRMPEEWLDLGDHLPWGAGLEAAYMQQKRRCVEYRKLIVIAPGSLGLAPDSVAVDDEVWLIAGSHTPMILRSLGEDRYKFIGAAYIHGIMHGEAFEGVDVAALDTRYIDLV